MAEVLRLAKVEEAPAVPVDFLLTETAKDCLLALHGIHAASEARFTMIAGAQGVGKTKALRHFASLERGVYQFTVFRTEGTSSAVSEVLTFLMHFGGAELYLAKTPKGRGEAEGIFGAEAVAKLAAHGGITQRRVPLAKPWLARVYAWRGHSTASIARTLRASDVTVRRWLKEGEVG